MPDPDTQSNPLPPTLGGGRFRLKRKLGEGGLGIVYAAHDRERDELVALKTLPEMDAHAIGHIKREFRALADVAHPNLVRLHELVADEGTWFFTMELVEGPSLLEHVRGADVELSSRPRIGTTRREGEAAAHEPTQDARAAQVTGAETTVRSESARSGTMVRPAVAATHGPLVDALRPALRQLATAVSAIHGAGKLHCDLKPSNVMVRSKDGRLKVLDFGLVTELTRTSSLPDAEDDHVAGTPSYMSPEQAAGDSLTAASDWYAVGVILFEALTGRVPFEGTASDVLRAKVISDAPDPSELVTGLPADLCTLCRGLLRRRPWDRPSESEILAQLGAADPKPSSNPRSAAVPFSGAPPRAIVGRDAEGRRLTELFLDARKRGPITVYVHGVSGIGKTTLISHFLRRMQRGHDAVVLPGRCYERELLPYKAFDSVIDALTAHLGRLSDTEVSALLPRDVHSLCRLFPVLRQVPSMKKTPQPSFEVADPHQLRRRAFASVKELLARIADRSPLVLYLDDLQWGDSDSAALLLDLLSPPDPPAMLFIASYRSDEAERSPFLRTLIGAHPPAADSTVYELPVPPLSADDTSALARTLEREHGIAAGRADAIAAEAAGSPFFVTQLVQYLANSDSGSDGAPRFDSVTTERVLALPEDARRVLELLAVAAHPLTQGTAGAAARAADGESALALLRAQSWIRSGGARPEAPVECYHDRIRDAVVKTLSEGTIRRYHADLAHTLEENGEGSDVELAEHFLASGDHENAAHYATLAAAHAAHALAFGDAARLYDMALQVGQLQVAQRRTLQARRGDALAHAGNAYDAAQMYQAAAEGQPPDRALDLRRRAAQQLLASGHLDEGLATLRVVLDAVGMRMPGGPRGALASIVWRRLQVRAKGLGFTRRSEAELDPGLLTRVDTAWAATSGLALVDTLRANDFQNRHLLLALKAGEPHRVARALCLEAAFAASEGAGKRDAALTVMAAARHLVDELDKPYLDGLAALSEGMIGYLTGRWSDCRSAEAQAEEILSSRCTGVLWELSTARRFLLSSLYFMGEIREVAERVPALLREAQQRSNLNGATDILARLQLPVLLAADRPDEAAESAERALERWSSDGFHLQHYNHCMTLCQCDLYRGTPERALTRLRETLPELRSSMLVRIQALRVEALYVHGRLLLASVGRHPSATPAEISKVAARLDRESAPWAAPCAAALEAGVADLAGHREQAATALRRAIDGFRACDMALHVAGAEARLGSLLKGDEGTRLCASAESYFRVQRVEAPERFVALMQPGFDRAGN